jgi:hypothetical protein
MSGLPESAQAYNAALRASREAYEPANKRTAHVQGLGHLDTALSSDEHAVYVDEPTKRVHIAYRGTVPTRLKDLHSDVHIGLGTHEMNARFKRALDVHDTVRGKYGEHKIKTTGHSLGGTLATHVNKSRNIEGASVFNPGSNLSLLNIGKNLKERYQCRKGNKNRPAFCDKLVSYRNRFDPISFNSAKYGKSYTNSTKFKNIPKAHLLSQFNELPGGGKRRQRRAVPAASLRRKK